MHKNLKKKKTKKGNGRKINILSYDGNFKDIYIWSLQARIKQYDHRPISSYSPVLTSLTDLYEDIQIFERKKPSEKRRRSL